MTSSTGVEIPLLYWDPIPLLMVVAAGLLYARAVSILRGRGRTIHGGQITCFYSGLALILLGTNTGIDPIGEAYLLSVHMLQHLLIADLSAPLLLIGIRAPVIYFFWPRPILVAAARNRPLRAAWRWLKRPHVAMSVWMATLVFWHVPAFYELALSNPWIHALEHISFSLTAVLACWPLFDPTHERLEGRIWKAFYVVVARIAGTVLGTMMIVWPRPWYPSYQAGAPEFGISALTDQQIAGAMMMTVDLVYVTIGFLYFIAKSGVIDTPGASAIDTPGASAIDTPGVSAMDADATVDRLDGEPAQVGPGSRT
jgi:putative membrane protein